MLSGFRTAAKLNAQGLTREIRFGYHAIPSMALLHMHVISQDFQSEGLKTVCSMKEKSIDPKEKIIKFIHLEETLEFFYE